MKISIISILIGSLSIHNCNSIYTLSRDPTYEDFLDVKTIIQAMIDSSTCPDPEDADDHWDWNEELEDCVLFPSNQGRMPLMARLVRLSFHDAAGYSDGFVDLQDPENAGLSPAVTVLDDAYASEFLQTTGEAIYQVISKADFYAWAGQIAVEYASAHQVGNFKIDSGDHIPDIPIRWGRQAYLPTSDEDPGPHEDFPSNGGHAAASTIEDYFLQKFGFNATQSATIMGAHTLGRARREFSGFRGMWTDKLISFDSEFYQNMIDPEHITCEDGRCLGWEQVRIRNGRDRDDLFQWQHSCSDESEDCTQLMLNADITFFRNMEGYICEEEESDSCENGQVTGFPPDSTCEWEVSRILASCFPERAISSDLVEFYANDKITFVDEFAEVFDIMIQNTPDELQTIKKVGNDSISNGELCPDVGETWCTGDGSTFYCRGCVSDYCRCKNDKRKNCKCAPEGSTNKPKKSKKPKKKKGNKKKKKDNTKKN